MYDVTWRLCRVQAVFDTSAALSATKCVRVESQRIIAFKRMHSLCTLRYSSWLLVQLGKCWLVRASLLLG